MEITKQVVCQVMKVYWFIQAFIEKIKVKWLLYNFKRQLYPNSTAESFNLYYAHSKKKDRTIAENHELVTIKKYFPEMDVINPAKLDFAGLSDSYIMKICLELVRRSRLVVFSEYKGYIGKGVYQVITTALHSGKMIYLLRNQKIRPITRENIIIHDRDQWSVYYAKVIGIKTAHQVSPHLTTENPTQTDKNNALIKASC